MTRWRVGIGLAIPRLAKGGSGGGPISEACFSGREKTGCTKTLCRHSLSPAEAGFANWYGPRDPRLKPGATDLVSHACNRQLPLKYTRVHAIWGSRGCRRIQLDMNVRSVAPGFSRGSGRVHQFCEARFSGRQRIGLAIPGLRQGGSGGGPISEACFSGRENSGCTKTLCRHHSLSPAEAGFANWYGPRDPRLKPGATDLASGHACNRQLPLKYARVNAICGSRDDPRFQDGPGTRPMSCHTGRASQLDHQKRTGASG